MARKKIKLTRPELKRQRDALERFERYLPMLKLKQQQLQLMLGRINQKCRQVSQAVEKARGKFNAYRHVLADLAGVNVQALATYSDIATTTSNVAGVPIPVFEDVTFPKAEYSLFVTPAWVDTALADLREVNRHEAELHVVRQQHDLLNKELTKIMQRVNLFEKVKIPEVKEAIRRIRIHLGDEMTSAVGRAKIAKGKLQAGAEEGGADSSSQEVEVA
ncbi:MAG: V-type ATP synthase subunit D [Planctomycetota bacterium]